MTQAPEVSLTTPHELSASALIQQRIDALRARHVLVALLTGVAMAVIVSLEFLALAMFADWWLDLPWAARLASLIAQLGALTYILLRFIAAPVLRQPDDDELALMVEKVRPEFRSRLIASLQLTRPAAVPPGASTSLVSALVEETETLARPGDFRKIVPTDRLKRFGTLAIFVPIIAGMGFAAGRETCTVLLQRVFLSAVPVPRKTQILVPEGDRVVGRGDTVRLEAFVQGIIPAHGLVEVKFRSRRGQEFPLEQNRDNKMNFARTLENVQDDFTYRFQLGDGLSPTFHVKAIPRPTVATIECRQDYPAYTGLPSQERNLGDLSLLAGSVLKLKVTATKDLRTAGVQLTGAESQIPMEGSPSNPREWTGQFNVPAKGLTGFQIQMLDTEHMESRDSAVYRVDVLPDKVPTVRILKPDRKEELVTRIATLPVQFEARDDFAIARITLHYKVDKLNDGAEKTVELDLEDQHPRQIRPTYLWNIGGISPDLSEGHLIEYWLTVQDNNDATGPGIGTTDHQLAKVVSQEEKRDDLLSRAGDYLGSISDVASDQEKLNKSLGQIIKAKAGIP